MTRLNRILGANIRHVGNITHLTSAFTSDGQQIIFTGLEPNKPPRTWIQSLSGGAPEPIKGLDPAEGVVGFTADGRW